MAFADLATEVEEMFNEQQERHAEDVNRSAVFRGGSPVSVGQTWNTGGYKDGFRIFNPHRKRTNRKASPQRLANKRESEQERMDEIVRKRLLAGERPKLGGRGRPPTRWFRLAAELGLVLTEP